MNAATSTATTAADLRKLPEPAWVALGKESLRQHLLAQAIVAHQKYRALAADRLDAFLHDPDSVRYPTRLVFEFGHMAPHQFAHPDHDWRNSSQDGRLLYLRPVLQARPDWVRLAVAYMVPTINYGDLVTDEHCVLYGAALLGMMKEEFYAAICQLADAAGAEPRFADQD